MDREHTPDEKAIAIALGEAYSLWVNIRKYVSSKYPKAKEEWSYAGKKYGWSFKIKDARRTIIYLLPRDKYFKVALVFSQKATDAVLTSNVSESIKSELKSAKVFAEGRGIRIRATTNIVNDITSLIDVKLNN
jgi:Protein of unknown function (DUF3788)